MNVLLLFLDGVGLGSADEARNPVARSGAGFRRLANGQPWTVTAQPVSRPELVFRAIDACLGVDGLPQSGTGQATLFTGVNCAKLAGRHFGPFPHSSSREALRTRSVFKRVADGFGTDAAVFANAFPPQFFDAVKVRDRWSTTTRACLDAGVRVRTVDDLRGRQAVAADVTGLGLSRFLKEESPVRSPGDVAEILLRLATESRFTLLEVFHTDKAGHDRSTDAAMKILSSLDDLLASLVAGMDRDTLLVVTSDHGNLEDLSVRTHTTNPVPLAAIGSRAHEFGDVTDLTGVTPAILRVLDLSDQ